MKKKKFSYIRKKGFVIGVLLLLLMIVALVACDHKKYDLLESTETDQLVPCPEEIVYGSYALSGESVSELYELLVSRLDLDGNKFEPHTFYSEAQRQLIERNCAVFSLRFHAPYKVPLALAAERLNISQAFEFDEIKILLHQANGLFLEYYLDGELCMFESAAALRHSDFVAPQEGKQQFFDSTMAERIIGLLPTSVSDDEPVISNTFPAMPDSIVLYVDGNAAVLQGMEKAVVFEMISKFFAAEVGVGGGGFVAQGFSTVPALEIIKGRVFVELRYNKPQKYVADTIVEGPFGSSVSDVTYESLLLGFNVCGSDETHESDCHIVYMKDGKYDWWGSYNRH
ncbi:MAG: hypothetical protein E7639_06340, partial [Ruminococcaceae bacterium]|nr:hypothetical protein [Oscillospiraceae bacterium]